LHVLREALPADAQWGSGPEVAAIAEAVLTEQLLPGPGAPAAGREGEVDGDGQFLGCDALGGGGVGGDGAADRSGDRAADCIEQVERLDAGPAPTPVPARAASGVAVQGFATHYCNPQVDGSCIDSGGRNYEGRRMGCSGAPYRSADASIVAVGPERYREWPCGTALRVSGPAGSIVVVRQDACPGCSANHVDLSEAGIETVCGLGAGRCAVLIEVLK
jgi:hypothetical protein